MAQHQYVEMVTATPDALQGVRRNVAKYLAGHLAGAALVSVTGDVLLVVQELLSNVYKHVACHEAEIRLVPQDAAFHVCVSDQSWDLPSVREPDWDSTDGRGMFLISQIDPDWQTTITGTGKKISCTVRVPGAPPSLR
ncbi:ATP-binding protein [Streptomyces sp. NPDC088252]|uniref:ATP-binding protein n=1 Tax=Streptomyces sp. NPDC088252 TaxID=3365845 RepID=UPI0038072CC9